ncbi:MAG: two-component system NtrC family sensor kinase [Motiliproteus sp.]|jgi:two-component system NtrC family sensor kinase
MHKNNRISTLESALQASPSALLSSQARVGMEQDDQHPGAEYSRVLILDNDSSNRAVLRQELDVSYRLIEAENAQECLDLLEQQPVDLLLLDVMLPGASGVDMLKLMQSQPEKNYPRVIVLSTPMDSKTLSRIFELGAADYLCKPFNRDELRSRVKSQIALAHYEKQLKKHQARLQGERQQEPTFSQLLQSEKMASIGQLAAGVAHEINNPVGFVYGNLNILQEYFEAIGPLLSLYRQLERVAEGPNDETQKRLIAEIVAQREAQGLEFILEDIPGLMADALEGTERIKTIVQGMNAFTRADDGEMCACDINKGIEATLKMVWNELKYRCRVEKTLNAIPPVYGNLSQLNQVFTNLLINAAHSIKEYGEISIVTEHSDKEVVIRIADTGCGIPPEHLERLFKPFFTTKPVGQGTGLGLYLSYEIILQHQGTIAVYSTEGEGSEFVIRLPAA